MMAAPLFTDETLLDWWDLKRLRIAALKLVPKFVYAWVKPVFQFLMSMAFMASFFSIFSSWFAPKPAIKLKPEPIVEPELLFAMYLLAQIQAELNQAPENNNVQASATIILPPTYEEESFMPPAPEVPSYNPEGDFEEMMNNNNPEPHEIPNRVIPEFAAQPAFNPDAIVQEEALTTKPCLNYYNNVVNLPQAIPASAPPIEYTHSISCGA